MLSSQMGFRDQASGGKIVKFDFRNNGQQVEIWDVTDLKEVKSQSTFPSGSGIALQSQLCHTTPVHGI